MKVYEILDIKGEQRSLGLFATEPLACQEAARLISEGEILGALSKILIRDVVGALD